MRILLVEDEKELRKDLAKGLIIKGYSVDTAENGEIGFMKALDTDYDLIVLDLNLPLKDGFSVLNDLMADRPDAKVLILSANSEIESKLRGFNLGAIDYLTKPFHFAELEARIRVLLHRQFIQKSNILSHGSLHFNTVSRKVTINDKALSLTAKELGLLEYFLLNQGRLISQQELIEHVWDESIDAFSNSVRVHMSSLRKKLKMAIGKDPITTKIGEGYILN